MHEKPARIARTALLGALLIIACGDPSPLRMDAAAAQDAIVVSDGPARDGVVKGDAAAGCPTNTFKTSAGCSPCSAGCAAGSYESMACTASSDRVCLACPPIAHCATLKCTSSSDHVCTACDTGYTLAGSLCTASAGGAFIPQAYLKAANADANDAFATVVATDGDTVVAATPFEGSNQTTVTNGATASPNNAAPYSGAVYAFVRSGSTWQQQAYLKPSNAEAIDHFGSSVGISGDTIVVGAAHEGSNQRTITNGTSASADNSAENSGAAYVFVRAGTAWRQQAYLKASNADKYDTFGFAVAISKDTIVVGAPGEDSRQTTIASGSNASADNSAQTAGAVYVFVRTGTAWTQQAYLKAPNADAYDYFGRSVAIDGDTIVVGATQEASAQTTITNGQTASGDNSAAISGAAYVFVRSGTTWRQQAYLKAANADAGDHFGSSVAISGDTIVVSASAEASSTTAVINGPTAPGDNAAPRAGAAYVFFRSGTTWSEQAYLKAPNAQRGHSFGEPVAIFANAVVVGASGESSSERAPRVDGTASGDNSAPAAGAAYVFTRAGVNWRHTAYLKAGNAARCDIFGFAVAISDRVIVCGAPSEDSNQTTVSNGAMVPFDDAAPSAGAAYLFSR